MEEAELLKEAVKVARSLGYCKISILQRRLKVGYATASRLIAAMQDRGIVSTDWPMEYKGFPVLDWESEV